MPEHAQRKQEAILAADARVFDSRSRKGWGLPQVEEMYPHHRSYAQYNRGSSHVASGSDRLRDTALIVQSLQRHDRIERLVFRSLEMKDFFATGISMGAAKSLDLSGRNTSLPRFTAKLQSTQGGSRSEPEAPVENAGPTVDNSASTKTSNMALPIDLPLQLPLQTQALREVDAVANERSHLLARKHGGQQLSTSEQERLRLLTAKLKELLPPVSLNELEALLEMTEEAERIRERARERRRRLGLG